MRLLDTYKRDFPYKGRGLTAADERIGGIVGEVEELLAQKGTVTILELGCGYGTALLELAARFGSRVGLIDVSLTANGRRLRDDAFQCEDAWPTAGDSVTGKPNILQCERWGTN